MVLCFLGRLDRFVVELLCCRKPEGAGLPVRMRGGYFFTIVGYTMLLRGIHWYAVSVRKILNRLAVLMF